MYLNKMLRKKQSFLKSNYLLLFNSQIVRIVPLKAALNSDGPNFCLDLIGAGVKEAGVELWPA